MLLTLIQSTSCNQRLAEAAAHTFLWPDAVNTRCRLRGGYLWLTILADLAQSRPRALSCVGPSAKHAWSSIQPRSARRPRLLFGRQWRRISSGERTRREKNTTPDSRL